MIVAIARTGLVLSGLLLAGAAAADTITVDITPDHVANTIRPDHAMGAGIDRLPYGAADKLFVPDTIQQILEAGWQSVTYRQNTELHTEAWHWNPKGSWSDPAGKGYFTGDPNPGEPILHSWGYPLPRRGVTRDDGTDTVGYSRLTDGDEKSFWKSNPYLTQAFTGEDDALHPQWIILDLASKQDLSAIRIAWAEPYAKRYVVQYWTGSDDPMRKPAAGLWQAFSHGIVTEGKGGSETLSLAATPVSTQFVRILMTGSSNSCDKALSSDKRNCVGYAIRELYLGTQSADGKFHDLLRHTADQDQTATYCSSVDPWHEPGDLDEKAGDQVGFDRFFTSGVTRGLPAMLPIAMIYNTPEDAANEIRYLEKRNYPLSHIEMGEEPDGHFTNPEDYAALYVQFAQALHKVDPKLKLGGPIFTGQNEDILTWPDASGDTSWTHRFIRYLAEHKALGELGFFSFEHYPVDPGKIQWSSLYDEAHLVTHIMDVWREDGVPPEVPLIISESNISSQDSEAYMDLWGGLWLADYIGAFLGHGGDAVYFFHYMPSEITPGNHASPGTFNFFSADKDLKIKQKLSQFFASQLITKEWVQPGDGAHKLFQAASDIKDGAGHTLVTAYAAHRPDGQWSLLVVNKDQENPQTLTIRFDDTASGKSVGFGGPVSVTSFGKAQYQWHPLKDGGMAEPDGPAAVSIVPGGGTITLPAASITVLRGTLGG